MKKRDGLNIEELDNDVLINVFSFFKKSELKNNRMVSKAFKNISDTALSALLKQTENQVFFTVGKPILISSPRNVLNKIFDFGYDLLWINFRKNIYPNEIKSSFINESEEIKLFKHEEHALAYARSLRIIEDANSSKGEKVYQPAIFKVQYLGKLSLIRNNLETLLIDKHNESDYFDGQIKIDVEYFEVDQGDIIPLLGNLKIEHDQKGNFKEYPKVEYCHEQNSENYVTRIFSALNSYMKFRN